MLRKILTFCILGMLIFTVGCSGRKESEDENMSVLDKVKKRDRLIVGIKYDTKPFGFINSEQKPVGFDIDIAREITRYILRDPNKVIFKQVTPSNRILMLNSGQVDLIVATMSVTEARKQVVNFSNPYYLSGQAIMVNKLSNINSLRDLKNKKVITVVGTTAEKNIRNMAPQSLVQGYRTYTDAFSALKNNRADALVTDDSIIMGLLMDNKDFRILPHRYTKEPYAAAVKKDETSDTLLSEVNLAIKYLEESGKLRLIKMKWLKG